MDQYLWQYTIDNDDGDEDKDIGTASSRPQPDCISGSPPAASADEVANTLPANKKRTLNEVLSLTDAMPDDNDVRQLYPHLCHALGLDDGFDPTDSSVRKSTVALLTEINRLLSTEYELVVIRAKAREKVHVRDTNADVIAFTNATNAGNKRNFSETKVDNISVIRKRQRDVGRDNAITYFEQMKGRELTWLSKVFDDAKEDCKGDDLAKGPT